jgi:hypothetical protein
MPHHSLLSIWLLLEAEAEETHLLLHTTAVEAVEREVF